MSQIVVNFKSIQWVWFSLCPHLIKRIAGNFRGVQIFATFVQFFYLLRICIA
jgi:hypothetical protein